MTLTLHYHPLSSICHKVLVALYERDIAFTPHLVDLGNEASRATFLALWPIGKFPVLRTWAAGAPGSRRGPRSPACSRKPSPISICSRSRGAARARRHIPLPPRRLVTAERIGT